MWRSLYREAIRPESYFDTPHLRILQGQTADQHRDETVEEALDGMVRWRAEAEDNITALLRRTERADPEGFTRIARSLLVQGLPLASTFGACLQGLSAPGVFEDDLQLRALSLLADDVGVGRPHASRFDEYRRLLERELLTEYSLPADELASIGDIRDEMFALPAVVLAMTRRSDALFYELVGVDHALRVLGLLPGLAALREFRESAIDWRRLDLSVGSAHVEGIDPQSISKQILGACLDLGGDAARRVADGVAWTGAALRRWGAAHLDHCLAAADPERAMADLVRSRAREASVYHHEFRLGGRDLAEWMRDAVHDPLPLIHALADSRLVRPGNADRSPLVNGLLGPGGRMFRIFGADDVAVIRRWIDHLPDMAAGTAGSPSPYAVPAARENAPRPAAFPLGIRDAYYLLQGRALPPGLRAYALDYVRGWLDAARKDIDRPGRSLPPAWPEEGLREWLLDQHDRHDQAFTETDPGELPERAAVIDSTAQLAPLTLIDGSWLLGFTDIHLASSHIGFSLFDIYWDELGNGQMALNHPRIYRDGLREMGVELAPTGSRAFAFDDRIREESLRLPVYWLSIGKLPQTFLPEILGLNLAMELSGVGGSYRSARRFLKHYGFSTRFVDIHNSIDNVSSGHSAWAAHAIDTHLRRFDHTGPERLAVEWDRVRVGYASLASTPPERRTGGLFRRRRTATAQTPAAEPLTHHPEVKVSY